MSQASAIEGHYTANAPHHGQSRYGTVVNGFELGRDDVLRFGAHQVPLAAVQQYGAVEVKERDIDSVVTTVAVFMGVAAVILVLVFEIGWRERFLVGGLLFASIAIAAIVDLTRTMTLNLFRLEIVLDRRDAVHFVTADRMMLQRLLAVLDARVGQMLPR